jgi:lipopolysaccharide biosynthesis regulator YciM
MELQFTQLSKTPATCSIVCTRCGYRMFQTKRLIWVCGPGCDGAQQWHSMKEVDREQDKIFQGEGLVGEARL